MSVPKKRHGQIKNALMAEARDKGIAPNDMYNRFFRELFLAELMARDDGWVLKGGTNLYCRIPGARHTSDLDLYRQDDPTAYLQAAKSLKRSMNGVRIGPYRWTVTEPDTEAISGTIDNARLIVRVFHGVGELHQFNIDVSGDLQVPIVTETITISRSDEVNLDFAGRDYTILSYPIENQVADKVCAMYELHGSDQKPSTRYRDLYDIALIALELDIDAIDLATALRTQQEVRNLTLPSRLVLPGPLWESNYANLTRVSRHMREELKNIGSALEIAGLLLNPLLGGGGGMDMGTWSPMDRKWHI